jgi:hypothetical protein
MCAVGRGLWVQQWLAGVHPDAVVKQVQHVHQAVSGGKPATVLRVPSLGQAKPSCGGNLAERRLQPRALCV